MTQRYRLILAVITLAAVVLLISPGTSWWVEDSSKMLGGTDETDARGHVALFTLLSLAWTLTLEQRWTKRRAITVVVAGGILLAAVTEVAQVFVPERGASMIDFGADVLGTLIGVSLALVITSLWTKKRQPIPPPSPDQ